jgi:hypothetical protein
VTTDERTKRDVGSINADQIGKVFVVRSHGLRECLVCGEVFTRSTAPAHAEINCYPVVKFCLLKPEGGNDGTQ